MGLLHRHLTRFIAIDVVLLILLLTSTGTSGSGSLFLFHVLVGVVLIPLGVVSVIVMHRRAQGGVRLGIATLGFIGAAFILLGVIGGIDYFSGNSSEVLLPVVLGLLGVTTLRRIPTMRNQSYILWYRGSRGSGLGEMIYEQEVLAACPACSSVLAVYPNKLTINDTCPNCRERLILAEEE
tara:strand:- start:349 stop:891 length:543 start_codon:yes stop_codon:yes gene_type:complete